MLPQCHLEALPQAVSKCLEIYLVNHHLPFWYHHLDLSVLHLHHNNKLKRELHRLVIHLIYVRISKNPNGISKALDLTIMLSPLQLLRHVNFNLSQQHIYTPSSSPSTPPPHTHTHTHIGLPLYEQTIIQYQNTHFFLPYILDINMLHNL